MLIHDNCARILLEDSLLPITDDLKPLKIAYVGNDFTTNEAGRKMNRFVYLNTVQGN